MKYPVWVVSLFVLAGCAGSPDKSAGMVGPAPAANQAAAIAPVAEVNSASDAPLDAVLPVAAFGPNAVLVTSEPGSVPPSVEPSVAQPGSGWEGMVRIWTTWARPMQQALLANCPQEPLSAQNP